MAPRAVRRQLDLLHRAADFRLLFEATLASGLGTWLAVIALTVDVFDRTHSGAWVSALLIADFLPAVAIGIALAPLVDRLERRRLMVEADLARAGVFVGLAFTHSAAPIVGLAAAAGFATGFFRPAVYAGLPNLVEEPELPTANSLLRMIENLTMLTGTAAGGAIVAAAGPHVAYWLNAATFAVSAALIAKIPARMLQAEAGSARESYLREIAEGFAIVRRSRALMTVLVAWSLVMVANALVNVSEVFLAKVAFHSGSLGYGLLWTGTGVGQAIGSLFGATWLERRGLTAVYGGAIALMSFGTAAAAGSPDVWVAIWCMVLLGAGNGAAIVYNALLVQRGAPDRLRGRAFTLIISSNYAILGLAMIGAGPLTDAIGARWVWAMAAGVSGVAALCAFALARGVRGEPEPAEVAEVVRV